MQISRTNRRVFENLYCVETVEPVSKSCNRTSSTTGWLDWRSDSVNPSWRAQVAAHRNAGTPLSGGRKTLSGSTKGKYKTVYVGTNPAFFGKKQVFTATGDMLDGFDLRNFDAYVNPTLEAQVINEALSKFYRSLWDGIRSLQGGVFLGEVRETLNMIRNPAKGIRKGIDSYAVDARKRYRKATSSNGRKLPSSADRGEKALADTWLEYAFGWSPLINDVKQGAEAFARLANDPNDYQRCRAQSERQIDLQGSLPASARLWVKELYNNYCVCFATNAKYYGSISVRFLGEVRVQVESPSLMAQDLLGFTWNDFAPTVWELIPYSFLVDYFTNIGDVISSWSFPSGRISWHNRSIRRHTTQVVLSWPKEPLPFITNGRRESYTGTSHKVEWTASAFERSQPTLGFPSVSLELPGSSIKWLNLGALARSRLL